MNEENRVDEVVEPTEEPLQPGYLRFPETVPADEPPASFTFEDAMEQGLVEERGASSFGPVVPSGFTAEDAIEQGLVSRTFPTMGEQVRAAGEGAYKGLGSGSTLFLSTAAGVAASAPLSRFAGPFAPLVKTVGGLSGLVVGLHADEVMQDFYPETPEDATRAMFEGGYTFGTSVAMAPVGFFLPAASVGAGKVRAAIGALGKFAREKPSLYMAQEAVASFYAGLSGMWAETHYPEDPFVRPIAEIAGGALSTPLRTSIEQALTLRNAINAAATPSPNRMENFFLQRISPVLEEFQEDPKELARQLRAAYADLATELPSGVMPTPGQLIDSPTLTAFERTLAAQNARFSSETQKQSQDAYMAFREIIRDMKGTGNPQMLKAAALAQEKAILGQFQRSFNIAQARAAEQVAKLGKAGSEDRAEIGRILRLEIERVLGLARETESDLWGRAIRSAFTKKADGTLKPVKITASNFAREMYNILGSPQGITQRRAGTELNDFASEFQRLGVGKKQIKQFRKIPVTEEYLETGRLPDEFLSQLNLKQASATDLVKVRGDLLEKARLAASVDDMGAAGRYGRLAEAILEDLLQLPGTQYTEARTFSRSLNDTFTRTFANQLAGTTRRGADRYSPEVVVQRAFSAGVDTTLQRMKEIQAAAAFVDPAGEAATSVLAAQQQMYRALASRAVKNGELDINQFNRFREEHADTIRFLNLEEEFTDISAARRALLDEGSPDSRLAAQIADEVSFQRLLEADDPVTAVSAALTNRFTPSRSFKFLVDLTANDESARRGLMTTIHQYAYHAATKTNGQFNLDHYQTTMFSPLSPNQPSLVQLMRTNGLMSSEEAARLKKLTSHMKRAQDNVVSQLRLDPLSVRTPEDQAEELAVAMLGARFASRFGPGGSGSLSFAQRTIKFADSIFTRAPARKRHEFLMELAKDPVLMAAALEKGKTPAERRAFDVALLRRVYSPGVFTAAVANYVDGLEEEDLTAFRDRQMEAMGASQLLRQLPPAPATRGTPNLQLQTPDQGPAGEALEQMPTDQGPMPGPTSSSREMFQRLFPNEMS